MLNILFQNDDLILLVKPRGISVQPGKRAGKTILEMAREELGLELRLVHRLDRETEGILALALNKEAAAKYSRMIDSPDCEKSYEAVCAGKMPGMEGFIGDDIIQHGETKTAGTAWNVIKTWETGLGTLSLVRLVLETGRMHQIRIHLAGIGNPVLGDDHHGDFKLNKTARREWGVKHLMLAAKRLRLGPITADSPYPDHFLHLFERLGTGIV